MLSRNLYSVPKSELLANFVGSLPLRLHVVSQAVDHLRNLPLLRHLVAEELHLNVALVRALVHPLFVPAFKLMPD